MYENTPFSLRGKTCFVAGAGGLLGQEFAKAFAEAGAKLFLADNQEVALGQTVAAVKQAVPDVELSTYAVDVTQQASCEESVNQAVSKFGAIDCFINSAAVDAKFESGSDTSKYSKFTEFPLTEWTRSVDVNLTGALLLSQAIARVMERQNSGSIIYIGSNYGLVGPDQRIYRREGEAAQTFKPPVYSVCKAGLLGLTKYLAAYYAGTGIRVNMLTPAGVYNNHDDEFAGKYSEKTVLRRMSRKEEYHGAAVFLASEASSYMTGANLVLDGGWTAL